VRIKAVKLNRSSFDHGRRLIADGKYSLDDTRAWSEHRPTVADENRFITRHGCAE
jgi:hypothetical protein